MNLQDLKNKFEGNQLEWRVQQAGVKNNKPWALIICYVDARAVMDRLDEVCGPNNWKDSYEHLPNGVKCTISIKIGDEWVPKEDGSPETDIESFKGGFSKALVRCAVKWGVGRYLYDLPTTFANFVDKRGPNTTAAKIEGKFYHWLAPNVQSHKLQSKDKKDNKPNVDFAAITKAFSEFNITKEDLETNLGKKLEDCLLSDRQQLAEELKELRRIKKEQESKEFDVPYFDESEGM